MSGTDPYIGLAQAGSYKRTTPNNAALTTSYQLLMRENSNRKGFDIQNTHASSGIYVRFGTSGPEWFIDAGGGFSRNAKTGSVWVGEIYIKGVAGSETYVAEEH